VTNFIAEFNLSELEENFLPTSRISSVKVSEKSLQGIGLEIEISSFYKSNILSASSWLESLDFSESLTWEVNLYSDKALNNLLVRRILTVEDFKVEKLDSVETEVLYQLKHSLEASIPNTDNVYLTLQVSVDLQDVLDDIAILPTEERFLRSARRTIPVLEGGEAKEVMSFFRLPDRKIFGGEVKIENQVFKTINGLPLEKVDIPNILVQDIRESRYRIPSFGAPKGRDVNPFKVFSERLSPDSFDCIISFDHKQYYNSTTYRFIGEDVKYEDFFGINAFRCSRSLKYDREFREYKNIASLGKLDRQTSIQSEEYDLIHIFTKKSVSVFLFRDKTINLDSPSSFNYNFYFEIENRLKDTASKDLVTLDTIRSELSSIENRSRGGSQVSDREFERIRNMTTEFVDILKRYIPQFNTGIFSLFMNPITVSVDILYLLKMSISDLITNINNDITPVNSYGFENQKQNNKGAADSFERSVDVKVTGWSRLRFFDSKILSVQEYRDRITAEDIKIFNTENPNLSVGSTAITGALDRNKLTYVTPLSFLSREKTLQIEDVSDIEDILNGSEPLLRGEISKIKSGVYNSSIKNKISTNAILDKTTKEKKGDRVIKKPSIVKIEKYMSRKKNKVDESIPVISQELLSKLLEGDVKIVSGYGRLPRQVKGIMKASMQGSQQGLSRIYSNKEAPGFNDEMSAFLNFSNIMEMRYLDIERNGDNLVFSWKVLDEDSIGFGSLVCRGNRYRNRNVNIKNVSGYQLQDNTGLIVIEGSRRPTSTEVTPPGPVSSLPQVVFSRFL